jgi:hypothetical protein
MRVDHVAADLALTQSRLWNALSPADAAAWIFQRPAIPHPAQPLPHGSTAELGQPPAPEWRHALEFAGVWARLTIPAAAQTAGKHWLLTTPGTRGSILRLTVGVLEVLRWSRADGRVILRLDADIADEAAERGELDYAAWVERECQLVDDGMATLADERITVVCPDLATAMWIASDPVVVSAARRLNTRLSAGGCPSSRHHRPDLAGDAWRLAEPRLVAWSSPGPPSGDAVDVTAQLPSPRTAAPGSGRSWDLPYRDLAVETARPDTMVFDPDAVRAGLVEHNRLCRMLHDHLAASGLVAGQHLYRVPVDMAWRDHQNRQYIAEIKSCLADDADAQFRLGLGQILEYRHRLRHAGHDLQAVLALTRTCDLWANICADLDVILLTADDPDNWTRRLHATSAPGPLDQASDTAPQATRN